jgi:hypothetical protein
LFLDELYAGHPAQAERVAADFVAFAPDEIYIKKPGCELIRGHGLELCRFDTAEGDDEAPFFQA